MNNSDIKLLVGGKEYAGWVSGGVSKSVASLAGAFSLTVNDRWPKMTQFFDIAAGEVCAVYAGDTKVIDGYVDVVSASYAATDKQITISGRDQSGDLVDCSAPETEYRGVGLAFVCKEICRPYGIAVRGTAAGLIDLAGERNDTCAKLIERAAKQVGALVWFDNGLVVSDKAIIANADDALELGVNVKEANYSDNSAHLFSEITVKTQNDGYGEESALAESVYKFPWRHRPKVIEQTGDSARRAKMSAAIMRANRYTVTCKVAGWRQSTGKLWTIGHGVHFRAPFFKSDGRMLIKSVHYTIGEAGTEATLTLCAPDAYEIGE